MQKLDIPRLRRQVQGQLRRWSIGPDERPMAKVMLWSAIVGPNKTRIAAAAKLDIDDVGYWLAQMRRKGILRGNKLDVEWCEDGGGLAFACDMAVLQGYLDRVKR